MGLTMETARLLTLQTAFGAAKMALEIPENAAALRARVTSPGGTTERAISVFQMRSWRYSGSPDRWPLRDHGNPHLVDRPVGRRWRALDAARHRSEELGNLLGGQP